MKKCIIILLAITFSVKAQNPSIIGIGLGIECFEPILETDIDLNINFTKTWRYFSVDIREGLRQYGAFENAFRSNTYLMAGYSTLKEKRFSFNMLHGIVYSYLQPNKFPNYNSEYLNLVYPAIKIGFCFRLGKESPMYLGLDFLASHARILQNGYRSPYEYNEFTSSGLISFNYQLGRKKKE